MDELFTLSSENNFPRTAANRTKSRGKMMRETRDVDYLLNKFSEPEVDAVEFDIDLVGPRLPTKKFELADLQGFFMADPREKMLYLHYSLHAPFSEILHFELKLSLDYGDGHMEELAISPDSYWRVFEMRPQIQFWGSCRVRYRYNKVPRALRVLIFASVDVDHDLRSLCQKSFILSSDYHLVHKLTLLDSHVGRRLFQLNVLRYLIASCDSTALGEVMATDMYAGLSPKLKTVIADRHRQLTAPSFTLNGYSFGWFC